MIGEDVEEDASRFHVTPELLDYDLFKGFVADVRSLGEVSRVHFTGGEPLLHPQLADMVGDFRTAFPAAEIVIVTNGSSHWRFTH